MTACLNARLPDGVDLSCLKKEQEHLKLDLFKSESPESQETSRKSEIKILFLVLLLSTKSLAFQTNKSKVEKIGISFKRRRVHKSLPPA